MSQEILSCFESQKSTAIQWRTSSYKQRVERISKVQKWINNNIPRIRLALKEDFKKHPTETDLSEIYPVTAAIKHTIKNLKAWMAPKKIAPGFSMTGTKAKIIYEPKGVSLIISPWNYPFNLAIEPLISALAAGCPVILKPSELSPHTSGLIQNMIKELFEPSEVMVFNGDAEIAKKLLELPFDHIFFTGSPTVGKLVMEAASKNLSSITLELGGKSPTIIHSDADLHDTAFKIVSGKFLNCGQTCIAPDYLLVQNGIKEQLLMELKVAIQKMYDPQFKGIDQSPDLARIINLKHYNRLISLLEDSKAKGAKIDFGGNHNPETLYIEPTLVSDVTEEMHISEEEIFGPLLPIVTYSKIEEAISLINKKHKPLALYYFGKENETYSKVIHETSSGNVVMNDCVLHFLHSNLPFGGVNNSGIGKSHGYYGYLSFSNEKGVLKQRVGFNNSSLMKPPYDKKTQKIISTLIKWL